MCASVILLLHLIVFPWTSQDFETEAKSQSKSQVKINIEVKVETNELHHPNRYGNETKTMNGKATLTRPADGAVEQESRLLLLAVVLPPLTMLDALACRSAW